MNDANNNNERRCDNGFINKLNGEGVECALTKSPSLNNMSTKNDLFNKPTSKICQGSNGTTQKKHFHS